MAEPLKATFFAFKKRDRMVLLPATLVMLVLLSLIFAAFVGFNWAFFAQIFDMARNSGSPQTMGEEQAAAFGFGIMGLFFSLLLFLIPFYLVLASYEAACLRWMIRGEAPGLFGFTFDHDMWRVYGVYWCWAIANFAISMVVGILMMPVMFMMMGDIFAAGGEPDSDAIMNMQLRMQGFSLLQYIPLAFFGVRLGPAAATSVARKRFSFFDAWLVTRGRFWALFGSFALLYLILAALWIGPAAYYFITQYGSWQGYIDEITLLQTSPEEVQARISAAFEQFLSPTGIAQAVAGYVLMIVVGVVWCLLSYGINARAALAALDEGKISVQASDD